MNLDSVGAVRYRSTLQHICQLVGRRKDLHHAQIVDELAIRKTVLHARQFRGYLVAREKIHGVGESRGVRVRRDSLPQCSSAGCSLPLGRS
jgi:hypothetical protein